MERRTFWQRQADEARAKLKATGSDDEVFDWAAQDALTASEYEGWLADADKSPEYATLATLILNDPRLYPRAISDLRGRLHEMHGEIFAAPYGDEEQAEHAKALTYISGWSLACDRLLFDGLDEADRQARLARIRRPEFARRVDDNYADQTIEAGRSGDSGAAPILREFFSTLKNGGQPSQEMFDALRERFDPSSREPFDRPATWDVLRVALEDNFLVAGGYRRALLTLPLVVAYLRTTARRAYAEERRRDARTGTPSNYRTLEIERSDLDNDETAVEPGAPESVELTVELREILRSIQADFLPSLPPAMRTDFVAVKLEGEPAADVARRTSRSRAAVSKNLAVALERLKNFLAQRG